MTTVFDTLFQAAEVDIREGSHRRDVPPDEGGRWPISIVLSLPDPMRQEVASLMREAEFYAGPGHFMTGHEEAAHITVRAIEPYRAAAAPVDPIAQRCAAAVRRTARATNALTFALTGVTLTSGSVMAQLEPSDQRAWQLMDRMAAELGEDAYYERDDPRDIFYANLIHFAADIRDPAGLIEWSQSRRRIEPVAYRVDTLELVRFHYTENGRDRFMRMSSWCRTPLDA
ncbi:hypothetical protein [Luteipulveratus mongoliensis]|uniref:Uncharacterized protein n=1 Tax=Luteipulveratus mongoliensis TaxID=571913 RepID=A0A0K1JJ76_9MICO|nr:hypothetical protein [Luteipulveratus mongoliensis]AKU16762.1 hypothetical protein VV02_14265 [Luteipulveratus mongoliensis]